MSGTKTRWLVLWALCLKACGGTPSKPEPTPPQPTTGREPAWVTLGRSEAHPDAAFLQAVTAAPITDSVAAAREAAEQKGRAALVRQFSSRVHSELRVDELVRAVDAVSRTDLTMEETVRIVGEGTLEGARAVAFHVADGFAHCLIVLDRAAGASELGRRIRDLDNDAAALQRQANAESARGASFALLLQAFDRVREARIQRVTFAVLAGRAMPRTGDVGETVLAALHSATATMRLAIEAGQGQGARVGASLAQPLVARLTDGSGAPVGGVELRFFLEGKARAELAPPVVATDGMGRARVEVHSIQGSGERTNIVACGIEGLLARSLAGPAARGEYLLPTPATTPVVLTVAATAHGAAHGTDGIAAGLREALARAGYPVVDPASVQTYLAGVSLADAPVAHLRERLAGKAAILVRVTAKAEDAGMRRDEVRARAQASVQIVDLGTGALDEFASDPADGLGASHAEAAERSLARLGEVAGGALRARLDAHLGL